MTALAERLARVRGHQPAPRSANAEQVANSYRRRAAEFAKVPPEARHRRLVLLTAAVGHCPQGHHLDETTAYLRTDGCLRCLACNRAAVSAWYHRHRDRIIRPRYRKTHCPHGHLFDEANTYVDPRGAWHCRACGREAARAYWHRKQTARRTA